MTVTGEGYVVVALAARRARMPRQMMRHAGMAGVVPQTPKGHHDETSGTECKAQGVRSGKRHGGLCRGRHGQGGRSGPLEYCVVSKARDDEERAEACKQHKQRRREPYRGLLQRAEDT